MEELEFSGERLVPKVFGKIAVEHLHRYALVLDYCKDLKVLDVACGEGYGSNFISSVADSVIGVDIAEETILNARKKYKKRNLNFECASILNLPFEDDSFDVVVSFETLEHLVEHDELIVELRRVLKNEGILIISTPDKKQYSDLKNYSNIFHLKELYFHEFEELIKSKFKYTIPLFQKEFSGSVIFPQISNIKGLEESSGDFSELRSTLIFKPEYIIFLASDSPIDEISAMNFFLSDSLYNQESERVFKDRLDKILNGFRYKLINILFSPIDFIKRKKNI